MSQFTNFAGECHAIDMTRGKASMMSTRGIVPWHGLGTVLDEDAVDSQTAIGAAGLDWSLYKNSLSTVDADNNSIVVPNQFAIVRGDTNDVLGVVGKNYKIFENQEAFSFFDEVVGDKLAIYETAGALHGGKIVWILAKLPKEIRAGNSDDISNSYVLLTTSHDGSRSVMMMPTLVRVVCNNTYTLAVSEYSTDSGIRMRHTKNMANHLSLAKQRLSIVNTKIDEYQEKVNLLAGKQISPKLLEKYAEAMFPDNSKAKHNTRTENMRENIYSNFEEKEITKTDGTWWKAVNAVTYYVDHQRSTKGKNDATRQDNRMISTLMTTGAAKKRSAMDLALEMMATV
jgi:phage/plasmid-like protein (TIGR03299 family)